MIYKLTIILGICIFFPDFSIGQKLEQKDTLDIVSFPEYLTFRTSQGNSYNEFGVVSEPFDLDFAIRPALKNNLTFTLLYRSIEIDFGFAPGFLNDDSTTGVDSKILVFNLRSYMGQWMQSFDFYKIKGFEIVDANFEVTPEVNMLYAPFKVLKIGGTTNYIFNKKFSFRAISFQNEWQRKSSGSFIPRVSYYYTRLSNDSPEKDILIDITTGPAYYYNLVLGHHWIASLGLAAGIGLNMTKIKDSDSDENGTDWGLNYSVGSRIALGYNSNRFFAGFNGNSDYFQHSSSGDLVVQDRQFQVEFYIGYRFNAPKKWNQWADQINERFGW